MDKLPLIEKIRLLESKLGQETEHTLLDPFKFNSADSLQVQEAGKKIARHIGLSQLTFIVTYANQKTNVSGHIQLDSSNDVFIEIDSSLKDDHEIVTAVLAHEICHKYLFINQLKLHPELENEMLTDAATIYTGLGKLSLNGCEKKSYSSSSSGNTKTTTTTTKKVGYMNRQQFSFVYRIICEMRNISHSDAQKHLSSDVKTVLNNTNLLSKWYFNKDFFNNDLITQKILNSYKKDIGVSHQTMAQFDRYIREIEENILPTAHQLSREFHTYAKTKIDLVTAESSKSVITDEHTYIKNLYALEEFNVSKERIIKQEYEIRQFHRTLEKFVHYLKKNYAENLVLKDDEFLFLFYCPSCENKMRIKEKKLARVQCKKCNYSFIADTGTAIQKKGNMKIKTTLWSRFQSFLKMN